MFHGGNSEAVLVPQHGASTATWCLYRNTVLGFLTFAPLEFMSLKVDSSEYMSFLHSFFLQCMYFLQM